MSDVKERPWLLPRACKEMTGRYEGVPVREGFFMALSDREFAGEAEYRDVVGDYLKFHFKVRGRTFIRGEHQEDYAVEAGQMSFLVQPASSLKVERVKANSHEKAVTLICSRDFASSVLSSRALELPSSIGGFLGGQTSRFSCASLPLLPQARLIVEDILATGTADPIGRLMMEARALDLLCLTVGQIQSAHAPNARIRHKDRAKVRELCALLESSEGANKSVSELVRLLAWNETQMMECFKQVTGATISSYRQRLRMERALRQLRDTDTSITQIAYDAGYEHPGNFATAFKRTFGYQPKFARERKPGLKR